MVRTYLLLFFACLFLSGCTQVNREPVRKPSAEDEMVTAEGKKAMILLTDRPANLETPLHYFKLDYTPNNVFFVRWHLSGLPATVDTNKFRLLVTGHVKKTLSLSLD